MDFTNAAEDAVRFGVRNDPDIYLNTANTNNPPGSPYNAVQVQIYSTLATGDVYSNDGLKGKISDEIMFLTPSGIASKTTWNSKTHVHVRDGLWIGFDSSNPAWP